MVKYKRRWEIKNIAEEEEFEAPSINELARLVMEVGHYENDPEPIESESMKEAIKRFSNE